MGEDECSSITGSDADEHGCIASAGYSWCVSTNQCYRPWLKNCTSATVITGDDRDENGCIASAGYSWCDAKNKCYRPWEEKCNSTITTTESVKSGTSEVAAINLTGATVAIGILSVIVFVGIVGIFAYCLCLKKKAPKSPKDNKKLNEASISYEQML